MPSKKVAMILKSKTELSDAEIACISDEQGWELIYKLRPAPKPKGTQICFTGFSPIDKERLTQLAKSRGLQVVGSITKSLSFLVTGPSPGPSKCELAREQKVVLMDEEQFARFLTDGEIPMKS
jgi:BRCT domain type II-containing protein